MSGFFDQDFDTLVVYALIDDVVEPDEQSPSLVLPEFGSEERNFFLADIAPYLSIVDTEDMEYELERVVQQYQLSREERRALESLRSFLADCASSGLAWFGYQLEPASIAGKGTARRLGLAVE